MTIFLCGFMGCGKTTVGHELSKQLNLPLIDTDEAIVIREEMSIPEIFEKKGEPYFRKVEAETVRSLCLKNAVVACGGGAMLNADTAAAARESGAAVIFIDVSFEECYSRIKNDTNRPIVQKNTKEQLREIFNSRSGIYRSNATDILASYNGELPEETAKRIIELLGINMPESAYQETK
ncbi:MAG: shikimate kinase [Ruminococcus sp.]|nr:shikimate kinase [Ruminococcus sp.]